MLNKAQVIGNLGADPELRYTQSGAAVCNMNVATNERWTDKSGEVQERVTWHRIVVWGKQAEACAQYLQKGRQVYVEGRMQHGSFEGKEGQEVKTFEINAERVQFLGGGGGGAQNGEQQQRRKTNYKPEDSAPPPPDDIPF